MATVLVVEDTADTRNMLVKLLRLCGHQSFTAENGEEALDVLKRWKPDVIILDVMMPVMDGIEFLERLRADPDPRMAGMPVILCTGMGDGPRLDRAEKLGVKKTFRKANFSLDDLLTTVSAHAAGPI